MNTKQLTKLASFAGKSSNDFWMATGKRPTDVIAELAMALLEANGKVQALAAENAAMKSAIDFSTADDMWVEQHDGMLDYRYADWYVDVLKAAMETPATDTAVAQIEAQGVDKAIAHLTNKFSDTGHIGIPVMALEWLAKELREAK